jgi:hypothetical protein
MKWLIYAVLTGAVIAAPVAALAQSNDSLTHDQVQNEIVQLERAGFNPANANTVDFPTNYASGAASSGQDSGYGPASSGSSQGGRPAGTIGLKPVFFGQ